MVCVRMSFAWSWSVMVSTGRLLRFDLEETSAGWNPQTWDILAQVPIDRLEPAFRRIPEVCNL